MSEQDKVLETRILEAKEAGGVQIITGKGSLLLRVPLNGNVDKGSRQDRSTEERFYYIDLNENVKDW